MPRSHQNRRRPVARAAALRPPPAFPAIDREVVTAAVGLALLATALLLG